MKTYHIHINGIVQGVGFRPFVYRIAKELKLNGYVENGTDGVHIYFNASEPDANIFFKNISQKAPRHSAITSMFLAQTDNKIFTDFSILIGEKQAEKTALMTPDAAICAACLQELQTAENRRYRYPFISCAQCGPRYSVVESMPYERENTAMHLFKMCSECSAEYHNVEDRRFFSQTSSCANCAISLSIREKSGVLVSKNAEAVLSHIKAAIGDGKILAVKGIGGYLLLCDAGNTVALRHLRERKLRPSKPFALLYPGIKRVENDFYLSEKEKALLETAEAPVVLLYPTEIAAGHLQVKQIAPGLNRFGVMLPYTPLLHLVATDFGKPLIATSANLSGSPIFYKEEDAHQSLFAIADLIVDNERAIIIPQDDSVMQVSKYSGTEIILRRSRGFAPTCLDYSPIKKETAIATGAFLKSCFTLSANANVFISQYLGSGESYESQLMYRDTMKHWLNLYNIKPTVLLTDKHPGYFSHAYAGELAAEYSAALYFIQHHEAHFAAVLAENNLLGKEESIMGVIWDGTGLGNDGNIWGGEFFTYINNEMQRSYHFDYFPAIAGDKLALEPRIAALCAAAGNWLPPAHLKQKFTATEWNNYHALINSTQLFSSSVGRIFDAVASMLDVCDHQTYEGEAAMYLQVLAETYVEEYGFEMDESYIKEGTPTECIPTALIARGIYSDIEKGRAKNYIAAKFHYSLVCLVGIVAELCNVKKICFSGGVFQNALLVDWIKDMYMNRYELYFHRKLSPNDENISFGQMVYYDNNIKNISSTDAKTFMEEPAIHHSKFTQHVFSNTGNKSFG